MKLKALFILFLIVLFYTPYALAQNHTIGMQGGLLSSNMEIYFEGSVDPGDHPPQFNRINNLYFSLSYGYNFFGKFHVNTGLEFYNKGAIMRIDTAYSDLMGSGLSEYNTNTLEILTYLSVPVSLSRQIHLDKNGKHRLILCAGLNFSYLLKAMAEGYSEITHYPPGAPEPEKPYIQDIKPTQMTGYAKWDISVHVGGGYRFQLNDDIGIGLDYRYLSNFHNVNDSRFRYEQLDSKSKGYFYSPRMTNQSNHVLCIGIFMSPGLFFGLEK